MDKLPPGVVRTPDARFAGLPGWPYAPRYLTLDDAPGVGGPLRLHVVDEGPPDAAETVLMLHGEPSWSYLYRDTIARLAGAGVRAVAFDFPGFGRSDKPTDPDAYKLRAPPGGPPPRGRGARPAARDAGGPGLGRG